MIVGPRYNDSDPAVEATADLDAAEADPYDPYDCDYCGLDFDANERHYLRPIGFTRLTEDGPRSPLVKTWCGTCEPDDECDPEAYAAVLAAFQRQTEETP